MKIEQREVAKLKFYPANVKRHGLKNLEAIKGSLSEFKQQKPIVVDKEDFVVAGNGTLAVARALGWKTLFVVVTTLPKKAALAYSIADNRAGDLGDWDTGNLDAAFGQLRLEGFDLGKIGFSESDIKLFTSSFSGELMGGDEYEEVKTRTLIECPECGHEFEKRKKKKRD